MDLAGTTMTQLTPSGTMYDDLLVDNAAAVMYIRVIHDTNTNGKFTDAQDHHSILKIDMTKPAMGTPLIPDDVRKKVLKILTE